MTNNVAGFDIGGIKGVIDTNTVIKRLYFSSTSTPAVSWHTLLDFKTGAAYQVPAAQKIKLIYFINHAPIDACASAGQVIYADDLDGNTNPVVLYGPLDGVTRTNFIFIFASVPTGKYINFNRVAQAATKTVEVYA